MTMNRLWNVKNPHQGMYLKVLCVCSAGLLRSPTAAAVLQQEYEFNTRSCGLEDYALIPLDEVLLEWTDEIVCMDDGQKERIKAMLTKRGLQNKPLYSLNVPDQYEYMNKELQKLILIAYKQRYLTNEDLPDK